MNKCPQVEILLASYNGEKYIREQIDSIINQSYENWVLTIRDDNSKDSTLKIINDYILKYPDKIFLVGNGIPTGSAKNNFFKLMELSTGEYMMCCDQDDVWHKDKIELSVNKILELEATSNNTTPLLVFTDLRVVDEKLGLIAESFEKMSGLNCSEYGVNKLLIQNTVTGCTTIFNRALCNMAIKKADLNKITMHDGWLALIAAAFGKLQYIPKGTISYRQHGGNSVGAKSVFSPSYIWGKIFVNNNIKKSMEDMEIQADEFLKCFGADCKEEDRGIISAFAQIPNVNKLKRIQTINKYNLKKNTAVRRLAQYLWI